MNGTLQRRYLICQNQKRGATVDNRPPKELGSVSKRVWDDRLLSRTDKHIDQCNSIKVERRYHVEPFERRLIEALVVPSDDQLASSSMSYKS
mgnify:FL=1